MAEWNDLLKAWYEQQPGLSMEKLAREVGIPRTSLGKLIGGRKDNLDELELDRRARIYQRTNLDVFRFDGWESYIGSSPSSTSDELSQPKKEGERDLFASLAKVERELRRVQRTLHEGHPAVYKNYNAQQRAEYVGDLLEQLAESLEFFRTGTNDDRKTFLDSLRPYGETYAYVRQMIETIQQGNPSERYMLTIQPPHFMRRTFGGKNG